MKIEKELAKETGKLWILFILCLFLLGVLGYLGINWMNTPLQAQSHYQIDSVAAQTGRQTIESPEYQALLEKYNKTESEKAREEGQSFVARIREGAVEKVALPLPPEEALYTATPVAEHSRGDWLIDTGWNEHRKKAIDILLQDINTQWQPLSFQSATVIDGFLTGSTEKTHLASNPPEGGSPSHSADREIIAPYTRLSAIIETTVDSDNPESQVLASVPAGRYAGAQLHARRVQLVGNGITIRFERLSWRGKTYAVEAYALDEKTGQSAVASEVNHRYFSRIILPAFAMGLGRAGQLFEQSSTQNTITPQGTVIQTRPSTPDSRVIAGTIVGGMGQQAAQVISSDASRLPIQQALLHKGQIIALQFIGGVYEKDHIRHQQGSLP